ncbi:MAG TPA: carboxypeptidase-like regulatory domain-containing protein [Bryobacteraceae bacterium]|nr:carboxypeptidase-like regulatory domain-containing protein [Bryobacteraceae bacterium]
MRLPILLLFVCALAPGYQDNASQGIIAGKVLNAATGSPLSNALVHLRYRSSSGDEVISAQTNDSGRFEFTGLWGHDWELSAELSGFAAGWYRASKYSPHGGFTLDKNQKLDSIVLKLVAQAVVTGKVSDGDAPVEGARVSLLTAGTRREIASAVTLDNGEYRIPRVPAGSYLVKAAIPRQPEVRRMPTESDRANGLAPTYYPNIADAALAASVEITGPTELRGIDIHLAHTPLFDVRGAVQVSGNWYVQVTLVDSDRSVVAKTVLAPPKLAFDFPSIPPGSYMVYAQGSGGSCNGVCLGTQTVEVRGQDVQGVLLSLVRARVPGVVKFPSNDRPAGWNRISVIGRAINFAQVPTPQYANLDKDLTFLAVGQFPPDFAAFSASVSNLPEGCYVSSIRYGGEDLPESGSQFIPDATVEIAIGTDGGHIDGTVTGTDDQPQPNAVIALISADGRLPPRSLQADNQGAFHFTGVAPGNYKLLAFDDVSHEDLANLVFVQRFDSQTTSVSLPSGGAASASLKIVSR